MATKSARTYVVLGKRLRDFDAAAAYSVAQSVSRHETVCVETVVRGRVVERIDVTAAASIDDPDTE
jgi:hypothetical protein